MACFSNRTADGSRGGGCDGGGEGTACAPRHVLTSDFLSFAPEPGVATCLVLLNHTLPAMTAKLWAGASYRICADGGSNRLYDTLPAMLGLVATDGRARAALEEHLPDVIIGDLDSVREDTRAFYQARGVQLHDLAHDQDSTDLMKVMDYIRDSVLVGPSAAAPTASEPEAAAAAAGAAAAGATGGAGGAEDNAPGSGGGALPPHHVIVLGALGGRFDHTLSNLNVLYMYPEMSITLVGDGNLVRLLRPGVTNVIRPNRSLEGPSCGLVPLGEQAVATSSGLKWNLDQTPMKISGLISTCNVIDSDEVVVTTDRPLLWMTETPSLQ